MILAPPGRIWWRECVDGEEEGGIGRVATGLLIIGCKLGGRGPCKEVGSGSPRGGHGPKGVPKPFKPKGENAGWCPAKPKDFA